MITRIVRSSLIASGDRKPGRPWFRYFVEEIFRKAVIGRNGRKRTKNTRCSFHCNCLILGEVARPERFELPAFWFVGRFQAVQRTTPTERNQQNQRKMPCAFGSCCTVLYSVHGHLHGHFGLEEELTASQSTREDRERDLVATEMRGGETIGTIYKPVKKRIECAWLMRVSRYADTA